MRVRLMAMLRAEIPRVAASTCGSIAPAYSAVHDPAALSSIRSPCGCPLSKIPAVTEPLLQSRKRHRAPALDVRRPAGRDRDWMRCGGTEGRTERNLRPAPYHRKN